MPEDFTRCVASGGAVRTVKGAKYGLGHCQYRPVCITRGRVKSRMTMGEVHAAKSCRRRR